MKVTSKITDYFIQQNWICAEDGPWFRYGLEKRLSTLIIFIPAFLLAVLLSGFWAAAAFFFSFFYLRSYTNGFHASSIHRCFILSIVLEVIFLRFIQPEISRNAPLLWTVYSMSLTSIFLFAPYRHPNMPLTTEQLLACKKTVIQRIVILSSLIAITWIYKLRVITCSIINGIALAAFLLGLAYIIRGSKSHE